MIFRNLPAIGLLLLPGAVAGIQDSGKDNLAAVLIKQLDKSQPMNVRLAAFKRFESGRVKEYDWRSRCSSNAVVKRTATSAAAPGCSGGHRFFQKLPCPASC